MDTLRIKENELQQLDVNKRQLTNKYNAHVRHINGELHALSAEEQAIVTEYKALASLEELNTEIQAVDARLELMADGNPQAIKEYEKRENSIENTQRKLEEIANRLGAMQGQITSIREQWEPKLDKLVADISDAFSHNFQKIGCAGQVGVYKDEEDFENWSIQIQVRFR